MRAALFQKLHSITNELGAFIFVAVVLGFVVLVGCGGREAVGSVEGPHIIIQATQPPVVTPIAMPAVAPEAPFPANIQSVQFVRTTVLHKAPHANADKVGVIREKARAGVISVFASAVGDGCKARWIQIAPRGWTCETAIVPSQEPPTEATPVALDGPDDDIVIPGVYGTVRGAQVPTSVRAAGVSVVDGVRYWRTTGGDLIDESTIAQFSPSKFRGVAITSKDMPAWVRGSADPYKSVHSRATPNGKITGEVARRTIVLVLEESDDGAWIRIADATWIARKDVRIASRSEPPANTGKTEKWFDVDRDEQVLVAYEGVRPVYATLVSTGKWGHSTPTVITRIESKLLTATMTNDRGEKYSVADVPWTMYYDGHYALHTSYWHDGFGGERSHGCINLAPRDARLLYQWSSPDVPPGWTAVYGDADNPGSVVRVRSRDGESTLRGYARAMRDRDVVAATE